MKKPREYDITATTITAKGQYHDKEICGTACLAPGDKFDLKVGTAIADARYEVALVRARAKRWEARARQLEHEETQLKKRLQKIEEDKIICWLNCDEVNYQQLPAAKAALSALVDKENE